MLSESNFLKNTKAIKSALDLRWDEYVESFGMNQKEAQKFLTDPRNFPLKYAMNFCERFQLDLENAFSAEFDAKNFARNYLTEQPTLPDKYQRERNSRAITLINFVSGLNDEGLEWLNDLIFLRLQIPKTILLYPDLDIPFRLILDYLSLVEKFSKDFEFMIKCGQEGIRNLNKKFQFVQQGMSLDVDFYDEFFSEKIKQFDRTYDYRLISYKSDELVLESTLKEEFKDLYKTNTASNQALLEYKCGITNGLPTLLGCPLGETTIIDSESGNKDLFLIKMPRQFSTSPVYLH